MENKDSYFDNALSNFIFDFACGGAIKHLADQGYSAAQIAERLDYPLSVERVREAVTAYYLEKGILLRKEPSQGSAQEQHYVYVQDHDQFGKPSFRRVPVKTGNAEHSVEWTKRPVNCKEAAEILTECVVSSGDPAALKTADVKRQTDSYVSCDYGREDVRDKAYEVLNERQREYLRGIKWDRQRMYHLLDARMKEIVLRLCERGIFEGSIFLGTEKKILIVDDKEEM